MGGGLCMGRVRGVWRISVPFPQTPLGKLTSFSYDANTGFISGLRMWGNARANCISRFHTALCCPLPPNLPNPRYRPGFRPPVYGEEYLEYKKQRQRSVLKPWYPNLVVKSVEADNKRGKSITAGVPSSGGWGLFMSTKVLPLTRTWAWPEPGRDQNSVKHHNCPVECFCTCPPPTHYALLQFQLHLSAPLFLRADSLWDFAQPGSILLTSPV